MKRRTANSPSKNGPGTESESVVVDMLLGNDTGPVYATLWNNAATTFIEQCETMNQAEDNGSLAGVVINLDFAQVTVLPRNDWHGVCLTAMRTLQSMSTIKTRTGTQLTRTKPSSSRRTDSCRSSVSHLAGYYPPKFAKLQRIHLPGVSDIPIGTFLLVLSRDANDKGWAPAVVNETLDGRTYARFT